MPLELKNITKEYKRGGRVFRATDTVSICVRPGDFVNIVGRSGSGKSTLLNIAAGMIIPTSGTVEVDGVDIYKLDDRNLSLYRNSKIGYIPQGQSILAGFTVLDNVRLPFYLAQRVGDPTADALSLLEKVGIARLAGSYPKQLSGGELKRISIARALLNRPDYLIADEPTGDLDVGTTEEIMNIFKDISKLGTAVLLVTHQSDTLRWGERTYRMSDGVLTEESNFLK